MKKTDIRIGNDRLFPEREVGSVVLNLTMAIVFLYEWHGTHFVRPKLRESTEWWTSMMKRTSADIGLINACNLCMPICGYIQFKLVRTDSCRKFHQVSWKSWSHKLSLELVFKTRTRKYNIHIYNNTTEVIRSIQLCNGSLLSTAFIYEHEVCRLCPDNEAHQRLCIIQGNRHSLTLVSSIGERKLSKQVSHQFILA